MKRTIAALALATLAACGGSGDATMTDRATGTTTDAMGVPTATGSGDPSSTAAQQTGITGTSGATATTRTQ